jgi:hypothetical protein
VKLARSLSLAHNSFGSVVESFNQKHVAAQLALINVSLSEEGKLTERKFSSYDVLGKS